MAGDNGYDAGFAPVRFRTPVPASSDYLMTVLVAASLPAEGDLHAFAAEVTAGWHPAVHDLFVRADPASFFPITIRAGERVDPWMPDPVTLLGDAIHTMPPAGGVGANTALQDAATLAAELLSGRRPVTEAVSAYESVMLPRGFDTVRPWPGRPI